MPQRVGAILVQVLRGVVTAAAVWWLTDLITHRQHELLAIGAGGESARILGTTTLWLVLLAAGATLSLVTNHIALIAGATGLLAGIIAGTLNPGLFGDTALFVVLRSANEPAIHALAGTWMSVGIWYLIRKRREV